MSKGQSMKNDSQHNLICLGRHTSGETKLYYVASNTSSTSISAIPNLFEAKTQHDLSTTRYSENPYMENMFSDIAFLKSVSSGLKESDIGYNSDMAKYQNVEGIPYITFKQFRELHHKSSIWFVYLMLAIGLGSCEFFATKIAYLNGKPRLYSRLTQEERLQIQSTETVYTHQNV